MEYAISFSDGSSAYLAHHGVKGMRWGVRNAETLARYAGGKGKSSVGQKIASTKTARRFAAGREYNKSTKAHWQQLEADRRTIRKQKRSGALDRTGAKNARRKAEDAYLNRYYKSSDKYESKLHDIAREGRGTNAQRRIDVRYAKTQATRKLARAGVAYARQQSLGKRIVKATVLGDGYTGYNVNRAAGKKRVESLLTSPYYGARKEAADKVKAQYAAKK